VPTSAVTIINFLSFSVYFYFPDDDFSLKTENVERSKTDTNFVTVDGLRVLPLLLTNR
jgi:hypothetical protein